MNRPEFEYLPCPRIGDAATMRTATDLFRRYTPVGFEIVSVSAVNGHGKYHHRWAVAYKFVDRTLNVTLETLRGCEQRCRITKPTNANIYETFLHDHPTDGATMMVSYSGLCDCLPPRVDSSDESDG